MPAHAVPHRPSYEFAPIDRCNMCGEQAAKVLGRRLSESQGLRPTRRPGITTTVVRCIRCGLIYCNPQPIPASIDQHYDVPPEEYWEPARLHAEERDERYFADQLGMFFRLYRGSELLALDVGAGVGRALMAMQAAGFDVWGIEPSERFCRQAASRLGLDGTHLICTSVEDAEFEREVFTFVSFSSVLEHVYDPGAAILKARDWLKPGGLVHIEVPSAKWLTSRVVNLAYRIQGLDYVANLSPMHVPYHLYEFTVQSFSEHGRVHSYEVAHSTSYAAATTYLPLGRLGDRLMRWVMERTGTGMQLEVWLRKPAP